MKSFSEPQVFLFLSDILRKPVTDPQGKRVGTVSDLVARLVEPYPYVIQAILRTPRSRSSLAVPWSQLQGTDTGFTLRHGALPVHDPPPLPEGDLLLADALLDKQILDTNGAKVRRVNDLQFLCVHETLHLIHVDVGFRGLLRRVGLERGMDHFLRIVFDYRLNDQLISWKVVQPVSTPDLLRLNIAQSRLAQLHPADLADIIEELNVHQQSAIFKSLDVETAAETLEETDPRIQVRLIEDLPPENASDILEEMSRSEAADLLGDLSKDKAAVILREMEKESADDLQELLLHPEEEAGGLMTTSFLAYAPTVSVSNALECIRREAEDIDLIYYVYVVDAEEQLLGVISLRELLIADPEKKLEEVMDRRVIFVQIDEKPKAIAEEFAKYGVMAMPVLDEERRIQGVIDFKNLLDVVAPRLGK